MALTKADMQAIAAMIAGAQKAQETAPAPETKTPAARKQNRAANTAKTNPAKQTSHNAECVACGAGFTRKDGTKTRRCRACIDNGANVYKSNGAALDALGIPREDDGVKLSQDQRFAILLKRDYEGLPQA